VRRFGAGSLLGCPASGAPASIAAMRLVTLAAFACLPFWPSAFADAPRRLHVGVTARSDAEALESAPDGHGEGALLMRSEGAGVQRSAQQELGPGLGQGQNSSRSKRKNRAKAAKTNEGKVEKGRAKAAKKKNNKMDKKARSQAAKESKGKGKKRGGKNKKGGGQKQGKKKAGMNSDTTQGPVTEAVNASLKHFGPSDEAQEFVILLRDQRAKGFECTTEGKKQRFLPISSDPLTFDCPLWKAAKEHSEDMAKRNYFSHYTEGSNKDPVQRAAEHASPLTGEVITWSSVPGPQEALENLLASQSGHCGAIMDPELLRIGVEWAKGKREEVTAYYYTGNLATVGDGESPQDCFKT